LFFCATVASTRAVFCSNGMPKATFVQQATGTSMAQSVAKEQKADEGRKHQFHNFDQMLIKKAGEADLSILLGFYQIPCAVLRRTELSASRHLLIAFFSSERSNDLIT